MKLDDIAKLANEAWLGRFRLYKPKKGAQIGIPYKPWHHLAIIGSKVFVYVWDTREIIDCYSIADLTADFDTVKLQDNGRALTIGGDTSERAKACIQTLIADMPDLPVIQSGAKLALADVREKAEAALLNVDFDKFEIMDDAQIVFVDKTLPLPDNMLMYNEQISMNPAKRKIADNNAYNGMSRYFAIQARCAFLADWAKQISKLQ